MQCKRERGKATSGPKSFSLAPSCTSHSPSFSSQPSGERWRRYGFLSERCAKGLQISCCGWLGLSTFGSAMANEGLWLKSNAKKRSGEASEGESTPWGSGNGVRARVRLAPSPTLPRNTGGGGKRVFKSGENAGLFGAIIVGAYTLSRCLRLRSILMRLWRGKRG
jgi:hypothetical protein